MNRLPALPIRRRIQPFAGQGKADSQTRRDCF
jgi:hypothetical protein